MTNKGIVFTLVALMFIFLVLGLVEQWFTSRP